MSRYPSAAVSRSLWHGNRPVPCPRKRPGDEQGLHLPRRLVQVAVGDPSADLSLAHRQEHCARRWPVGLRQRCELGSRPWWPPTACTNPGRSPVAGTQPASVLATSGAEGLVVAARGRHRDLVSHPPQDGPRPVKPDPLLPGGRDEVGEHDQVVLVVAGRAVERPTAGDQPQPGVVDVAVDQGGGEPVLGVTGPRR